MSRGSGKRVIADCNCGLAQVSDVRRNFYLVMKNKTQLQREEHKKYRARANDPVVKARSAT